MTLDSEHAVLMREDSSAQGYVFTRASDAKPHMPRQQRAAADSDFALHPAIERGMAMMREGGNVGGATALTLFSNEAMSVSYVWFKSGYPLPIHSHDVDCYYQIIAGSMRVGTEDLSKGDGVLIPAGAPYSVTPGDEGVEFFEFRTSPDYDTHYRAKTDAYWDRISETRQSRKDAWAQEKAPYGLMMDR